MTCIQLAYNLHHPPFRTEDDAGYMQAVSWLYRNTDQGGLIAV
jgi:hypothetical protein